MTAARDIALQALRDPKGHVTDALDRLLAQRDLPAPDRGLARELTLGVVRHRATLLAVMRAYLAHPDRHLPAPVPQAIQLAIYQLLFMDRIPTHAAVDEAVRQVRKRARGRFTGMVNGLLRTLLRERTEPEPIGQPARNVVPVGPDQAVRLERDVLPEPATEPAEYLAAAWSLPTALARRWQKRLGKRARAVAAASLARPPVICRANRLRTDIPQLIDALAADHLTARPHANGLSVVLDSAAGLTAAAAFRTGLCQPQDPTATAVVLAARPRAGQTVLDLCAAPGTKTTHLAECMNNAGRIDAVDVNDDKLQLVRDNGDRLGIDIVRTHRAGNAADLAVEQYDLALADVPCSNTGVLARRPEAKWRFDPDRLGDLTRDQLLLAETAARMLRPGGLLVYSTCSIEPEENRAVVDRLRKRMPHLRCVMDRLTLPETADPLHWHDGGYVAILTG
jgi:16S rRNA (cytosine967-C5)-methyltransferase